MKIENMHVSGLTDIFKVMFVEKLLVITLQV